MKIETSVTPAPETSGALSKVIGHPATKIIGISASYVGTAIFGWWAGKKLETAYKSRQQPNTQSTHHRNERPRNPPHEHAQA